MRVQSFKWMTPPKKMMDGVYMGSYTMGRGICGISWSRDKDKLIESIMKKEFKDD